MIRLVLSFCAAVLASFAAYAADDEPRDRAPEPRTRPEPAGALTAPASMWAAQTSATQITLVWHALPGAASYRLYFDSSRDPRPPVPLAANVTRFVAPIGALGQPHAFSLEALDAQGHRSPRAAFNLVTPVAVKPGPVAPSPHVSAGPMGEKEIVVSWEPVPGATAYGIGRAVGTGGFQVLCDLCPTTGSFIDRSTTPGASHTYLVTTVAPNGRSMPTRSNPVTLPGSAGAAPAPVPQNASAIIEVRLSWSPVSGARQLRIERSSGAKDSFSVLATLPGTSTQYVDHLSSPLPQLAYRIVAIGERGDSTPVPFTFR